MARDDNASAALIPKMMRWYDVDSLYTDLKMIEMMRQEDENEMKEVILAVVIPA